MKIIRFIIILAEIFICYVVQGLISVKLPAGNIIPDMIMVITCGAAWMFGSTAGVVYGFLAGLLVDIGGGQVLGFASFVFMSVGFIAGSSRKFYSRSNYVVPLLLTAAGEFIYLSLYYFFFFITRGKTGYSYMVHSIILPRVTLTVFVAVFLYKLFQLSVMFSKAGEKC